MAYSEGMASKRNRNSSRYLGTITKAQLDQAARECMTPTTPAALFAELAQGMGQGPSCSRPSIQDRARKGMWPGFWHRPDGYGLSVVGRRGTPGDWALYDERHHADPINIQPGEPIVILASGTANTLDQCWCDGCIALAGYVADGR